jgi:dihydroflavonol-4-reductase
MSETTTSERVLVTGGSGFVATHCLLRLHQSGYTLRSTIRDPARSAHIDEVLARHAGAPVPVDWYQADLENDRGWREAVDGVDYVLHVASPLPRTMPKDPEALIRPARDGALRLLHAAAAVGVKRVVMTSSTAAVFYGYGDIGRPFTEADWSDPESSDNSIYTRSKTYAERAAWEFMSTSDTGMELTTINPSAVLGPVLERDYGTSAEIVLKLLNGSLPGLPRLGFPVVDVRDVADLHVRAMTHPEAAGERFLCASEFMWMEDMAEVLREHLPDRARRIPRRRLPDWLMRIAAMFDPVIRSVIFELGIRRQCDVTKARSVLGFSPRPGAEAVTATANSLVEHGIV